MLVLCVWSKCALCVVCIECSSTNKRRKLCRCAEAVQQPVAISNMILSSHHVTAVQRDSSAAVAKMMNPNMSGLQPGVILLREGTDTSQGKAQLISNINACQAVAEAVRTTLGPRGMDKLIHDGRKVRVRY